MGSWEITIICLVSVIALSMLIFAFCAIAVAIGIIRLSHSVKSQFDPLLHALHRIGRCVDDETEYLDESEQRYGPSQGNDLLSTIVEITKWAAIGGTLFSKFRKRR